MPWGWPGRRVRFGESFEEYSPRKPWERRDTGWCPPWCLRPDRRCRWGGAPCGRQRRRWRKPLGARSTSAPESPSLSIRHHHVTTTLALHSHTVCLFITSVLSSQPLPAVNSNKQYVKLHKFILYSNYYLFVQIITESLNKSDSLLKQTIYANLSQI